MKKTTVLILFSIAMVHLGCAQAKNITTSLYENYQAYKEPTLNKRRIKHEDLQPLIRKFRADPRFTVTKVGESIEGRALSLISTGKGDTDVYLWSQMHGDEPTATQAIFDILNFLASENPSPEKELILRELKIHFLPMLNPDGAAVFQRRNTLGIDINRDALRLQSPEGQTLKRVRDSLEADFGFNLHDQSTYYNAERTPKPATISYLAPAYNYEKEVNEVRANAMKVIAFMNRIVQRYAPGQVGKYNDDFEPRAFGDNIQKWGTSTILIESGGYPADPEKQEIRKLNYVSILAAIHTIAAGTYKDIPLEEYEIIPENDRKLFDLKIENATYPLLGKNYVLDIGIHRLEVEEEDFEDFWYSSRVVDQGDLSTYYGYETVNAEGYTLMGGKVYPKIIEGSEALKNLDLEGLLKEGYAYVPFKGLGTELVYSPLPVHLVAPGFTAPEFRIQPGVNPTFFLLRDGKPAYAVINGFMLDLTGYNQDLVKQWGAKNAMIYR